MKSKIANSYLPEILALHHRRSRPSNVSLNVTATCNQNCIYCEIGKGIESKSNYILTKEDVFWIIDEMEKAQIPKLSMNGGEPFLFYPIFEVVKYAASKKIKTTITSNGMTIFKLPESSLKILQKAGTEINISIDSFDPEINTKTRGSANALENAIQSIQRLQDFGVPLLILVAISKYNFKTLTDTVKGAFNLGVKQVLFQPIIYASNFPDRDTLDKKNQLNVPTTYWRDLKDQLNQILKFEKKHDIKTNVYRLIPWIQSYLEKAEGLNGQWFFENILKKFYCRDLYAMIDITYTGGIQSCGLLPAPISIKNHNGRSLIDLWLEATKEARKHLENGEYFEACNGCCHHFSRNMIASMLKHPIANFNAWKQMTPLLTNRITSQLNKKILSSTKKEKR